MVLDDVGTYLQAQGIGTLAQSLFKGAVPLDTPEVAIPDAMVALIEVPGLPPMHVHSQQEATYEQPAVQVLTRAAPYAYEAARTKALQAFVALDGLANIRLSGTYYLTVQALQSPFFLRTDERGRPYIAFTVRCQKEVQHG